jgi:hypothetical protein
MITNATSRQVYLPDVLPTWEHGICTYLLTKQFLFGKGFGSAYYIMQLTMKTKSTPVNQD